MRYRLWLLIAVMIVSYVLPWVINPGVSLTLGGYDLGEWTSLHDAVRGEQPPLLTSFLLRLPLALVAVLIGVAASQPHPPAPSPKGKGVQRWLLPVMAILLITVALLPPLEILDYPNDPNYQQQALVAGIALVGGLLGVSGIVRRIGIWLRVVIGVVGAAAVIAGLSKAYQLMQGFSLPVSIGIGGVLLAAAFGAVAVTAMIGFWTGRRVE